MAETENIAKMAQILSDEIFDEFLWKPVGPRNHNWACEKNELHGKKTHPTDVAFYYEDPYSTRRCYVNVDLKSYKKSSIKHTNVRTAIESLAKSLDCAYASQEWQEAYLDQHVTPIVHGLLFIYNHDGEFDSDFNSLLEKTHHLGLGIPRGSRIFVFSPKDIFWLNNIASDINGLRGKHKLPDREYCSYYYPNLVLRKNVQPTKAIAANLEMLSAPWIPLRYKSPDCPNGTIIYYKKSGSTVDEFLYLLDYLLHYNIIEQNHVIQIRVLEGNPLAAVNFAKAIDQYIEFCSGGKEIRDILNAISFESMPQVIRQFSSVEIGMRND